MSQVRDVMRGFGIKVSKYEALNQLQVTSSREFYLEKCEADKEKIKEAWSQYAVEAQTNGFMGLIVAGDVSCFLDEHLESELFDYELSLEKEPSGKFAALCMYHATAFDALEESISAISIKETRAMRMLKTDPSKRLMLTKLRMGVAPEFNMILSLLEGDVQRLQKNLERLKRNMSILREKGKYPTDR